MAAARRRRHTGGSLLLSVVLAFTLVLGGIGHGDHRPAHGVADGQAVELASRSASTPHAHQALLSAVDFGHCQGSADNGDCLGVSGCAFCVPSGQHWQPDRSATAPAVPGIDLLLAPLTAGPPTPPPKLLS